MISYAGPDKQIGGFGKFVGARKDFNASLRPPYPPSIYALSYDGRGRWRRRSFFPSLTKIQPINFFHMPLSSYRFSFSFEGLLKIVRFTFLLSN